MKSKFLRLNLTILAINCFGLTATTNSYAGIAGYDGCNAAPKLKVVSIPNAGHYSANTAIKSLNKSDKGNENEIPATFTPELARLEIEGFSGSYTGGDGYGLLRLAGNNKNIFYGSTYANYQDTSHNYIVGAGVGYRNTLKVGDAIGAYVYADRDMLKDNEFTASSFWVINPGIEWLGKNWDLHFNGYLPTGQRQWTIRDGWADQFGVFQYVRLQGHTMYDKHMAEDANIGRGFDVAFGAAIPQFPRAKVYLGSYYFNQANGEKINGIFSKLNFALLPHTALTLTDSYDKEKHNTFTLGLKFVYGVGVNDSRDDGKISYVANNINERLLEAPQRNWTAQNYGLSVPLSKSSRIYSRHGLELDSGFDKELDNIYSFRPNYNDQNDDNQQKDSAADGTFEHPFSYRDFNQATLNQIGTNANLFFGGADAAAAAGNINILTGQSLYGRSSDFLHPATGDERVAINGSLNLGGNNILDSIRIENSDGIYQAGINFINSNSAVYLRNVDIGDHDGANKAYPIGINAANVNLIDINDSHIYAANSNGFAAAGNIYGIELLNSKANIKDSVIESNVVAIGSGTQDATNYGIFADDSSLNISGGTINVSSVSRGRESGSSASYGIYANNHTQVEVNNVAFTINSDAQATNLASAAVADVYGVFADRNSTAVLTNSRIDGHSSANAKDTGEANSYGLYAAHGSALKASDSAVTVASRGNGDANGVSNSYGAYIDGARMVIANSQVSGESYGASTSMGYGVFAINGAYVTLNGGNNMTGTGMLMTSNGAVGNGYGIYAENAAIYTSHSIIAGIGSSNAYGIYAKDGDYINLLDCNNIFVAHNNAKTNTGDSYGIYAATGGDNYFANDNYKYSNYDVTGGSAPQNWYPDPLPSLRGRINSLSLNEYGKDDARR